MKKRFVFDLSILALAVVTSLSAPLSAANVAASTCGAPSPRPVTAVVSTDTMSAVAGAELPFRVTLVNDGDQAISDGSVIIKVSREPRKGDFSQGREFIVTRAVVKSGVALDKKSAESYLFAWSVPAGLPSGVYRADAGFSESGFPLENADSFENRMFGNSAKVLISGDVSEAVFLSSSDTGEPSRFSVVNATANDVRVPVTLRFYKGGIDGASAGSETTSVTARKGSSAEVIYSKPSGASVVAETSYKGVPSISLYSAEDRSCGSGSDIAAWAMLIGGLGVVVLVIARRLAHKDTNLTQ